MINKYQVYKAFEMGESSGKKLMFQLDKENDILLDPDTGETVCDVDTFVRVLRKEKHCDFEVIYSEHVSLTTTYRCKQCGTVIFGGDDERFDPNLKCPGCGGYKTQLEFWTGEEIQKDINKQHTIEQLIQAQKLQDEMYERIEQRNGLNDWEIWKKKYYGKKHFFEFSLECCNLFHSGLKGLNFHITHGKKDTDGVGYICKDFFRIPLSLYAIYIQWIVPIRYRKQLHNI